MAIYGMFEFLAGLLASALQAFSLAAWSLVVSLAGGPQGPLWRWVLVEQGLFLLLLSSSVWWIRAVLGRGLGRERPHRWGSAVMIATALSLLWNWYALLASQAILLGLHPQNGWEWTFYTWGFPLLVAGGLLPGIPFLAQLGFALGFGAILLLDLGRVWAWVCDRTRRHFSKGPVPARRDR